MAWFVKSTEWNMKNEKFKQILSSQGGNNDSVSRKTFNNVLKNILKFKNLALWFHRIFIIVTENTN